ncbi:hypothetical protein ACLZX5_03710 [Enterococcus faecium]
MEKLCQYQMNLSIIRLHEPKTALLENELIQPYIPMNYTVIAVGIHFTAMIINRFMKAVITKRVFPS